jgi:hypothetical protein
VLKSERRDMLKDVVKVKSPDDSDGYKCTFVKQPDGTYTAFTSTGYELTGYRAETIQGWLDGGTYVLDEDKEVIKDFYQEVRDVVESYNLRFTQTMEPGGKLTYSIVHESVTYRAKSEEEVRKILDLIVQLDQYI